MREKRIPTFIGIILVILILSLTVLLVKVRTSFLSKADITSKPKNILISNLKADQFSISWFTDKETEGFLTYGKSESLLENFALDKRDQVSGSRGKFKLHFITVSGLQPETSYYFKIISDGASFGGNFSTAISCQDFFETQENASPFKIMTLKKSGSVNSLRNIPISGMISKDEKGSLPVTGSLVCIQIPNVMLLSDLTSNTGNYVIPLVSIYKQDGNLLQNISPDTNEDVFAYGPNGEKTIAKIKSQYDHPIPVLQLDKTYDFNKTLNSPNTPTPTIFDSLQEGSPASFELISPIGAISDTLPTFRGKGEPGQILDVKVESDQVLSASVKVDENGFWSWTLPSTVTPGEHTVTITSRDKNGVLQKIVKKFTVLAANPIMPNFVGTPSAKLTATPTIEPIPTPTNTPTPSPIPTEIPIATATPTIPVLLNSATSTPFFVFLTIGIISVTLGILMFFKKPI